MLALLPGCTRPNPAFGLDAGEDGQTLESNDGDGTVGSVTTSEASGASGAVTEGGTTLGASGSDGPFLDSSGSGSPDTGLTCSQDFEQPYGIESNPSLEAVLGECPELASVTMVGSSTNGNTQFDGEICPECNCGGFPISMTFDIPLPPTAGCVELVLQLVPETCEVMAYTMKPVGGPTTSVVSNVTMPDFAPLAINPIEMMFAGGPALDCNEQCFPPSGFYDLFAEGLAIPPTRLSVPVGAFWVVNDGSGIDQDCVQIARWYAVRI